MERQVASHVCFLWLGAAETTEHHQSSTVLQPEEEAVPQSGGSAIDALQHPAWGEWDKQSVSWVSRVFQDREALLLLV